MSNEFTSQPNTQTFSKDLPALLSAGRSDRTVSAIRKRFETYMRWADKAGVDWLPAEPDSIILFLEVMESWGYKANTIQAYMSAISAVHDALGFESPTKRTEVREAVGNVRRRLGARHQPEIVALSEDDIERILSKLRIQRPSQFGWMESLSSAAERAATDAALLLVMTQAGLRRSEAADLNWEDIRRFWDGSGRVTIRSRKPRSGVPGHVVAVKPDCLRALMAIRPNWIDEESKVFEISVWQITKRLKAMCEAAGIDPKNVGGDTPRHSLVRIMIEKGAPLHLIQLQARWRTSAVLMTYTCDETAGEALRWI